MPNLDRYGDQVARLVGAMSRRDDAEFAQCLDDLVHHRRRELFAGLRKLTEDVRSALERFKLDSRFADLAEKEVPDARQRLTHVMRLTDDAAHRTLDLVEKSGPLAERIGRGAKALAANGESGPVREAAVAAFIEATAADADALRRNLSEVLLAQGYQDLTGQIIRGVITLVTEVETALANLVHIAQGSGAPLPQAAPVVTGDTASRGHGPAVPGIDNGPAVGDQGDVDALLSDLGL
jgi:chemotaxis protein CheZ